MKLMFANILVICTLRSLLGIRHYEKAPPWNYNTAKQSINISQQEILAYSTEFLIFFLYPVVGFFRMQLKDLPFQNNSANV